MNSIQLIGGLNKLFTSSSTYGVSKSKINPTSIRGYKKSPKCPKTKSAAKKRFRVTGSGYYKAHPSGRGGAPIVIKRDNFVNLSVHLGYVLPHGRSKAYVPSRAKGRYLDQDYEFDGI